MTHLDPNEFKRVKLRSVKCPKCKAYQIIVHDFHSQDVQSCPECGDVMEKQISLPAVHFKGTGFYKTDNR